MKSLRDVRIVAWLFILFGVLSAVGMFQGGKVALSTGVLAIPTGVGLLRFSSGWRTFALVCLWLTMIGYGLGAVAVVTGHFSREGIGIQSRSPWLVAGVMSAGLLVSLWLYRVLIRYGVRRWFELGEANVP